MSEEKESTKNALQEVTREVVITPEDCNGAADFWTHFEIPMIPELRTAFDEFVKNPNIDTQDAVKLAVCQAIGSTDHEAFNDEMFKEIVEECRNVWYEMSFNKSLENHLPKED